MTVLTTLSIQGQERKKNRKTLCTWSLYLQVVYEQHMTPLLSTLQVQPNPTLKCAAVNVRVLLWRLSQNNNSKKRPLTSLPAFCPLLFCKSVRASSPDAGCASNCAVAGHSCAETPFRSGHSCRA